MRPLLPPELLWLRSDELFSELKKWPRVQLKTERLADKAANTNLRLPDAAGPRRPGVRTKRRWIICAASSSPLPVR
ncbi:hypothetical protein LNP05_13495 [Klebsiella pneumoniae subsp. pneumoniae]|nr:hypothetical protein [Klebsiella pneumoniae subsp. pneumoniae]